MIANIRLREFTETPGGRYKNGGKYSGEEFRDTILEPVLLDKTNEHIIVDLDGVYGLPTCFLDEVFGGLVRKFGIHNLLHMSFKCDDEPDIIEDIKSYMLEADH